MRSQVTVDTRDAALGAYSYQMKVYEMTATGLLHMSDADLSGHFEVVKGSDEHDVDAKEGAFVFFSGVNVQKEPGDLRSTSRIKPAWPATQKYS